MIDVFLIMGRLIWLLAVILYYDIGFRKVLMPLLIYVFLLFFLCVL